MKSTDFAPAGAIGEGDSVALCDHIREISIHRLNGKVGQTTKIGIARIENAIAYLLDGSS
jgi:mRNA-degrading endonuclease toxin of MazEF toxin-antitoxin module